MGINDYIQIGSKIKKLRIEKGISQRDMAKMLNLSYSTYSNYENNHREPSMKIIERAAEILGVTIPELTSTAFSEKYNIPADGSAKYDFSPDADKLIIDTIRNMEQLNDLGKEEAAKRVYELTLIDKYRK